MRLKPVFTMKINLKALTPEGETYHFDRSSEEFHGVLDDIIGKREFAVDVEIRPLGNSFEMRGKFAAAYTDSCSKCGYDVDVPITNKINEILVIEEARPRHSQSVRGQNSVKFDGEGPSVTYLNNQDFMLSEFIHEMVASSMEAYPQCSDQKMCHEQQYKLADEPVEKPKGHPAFQVLEAIKNKH